MLSLFMQVILQDGKNLIILSVRDVASRCLFSIHRCKFVIYLYLLQMSRDVISFRANNFARQEEFNNSFCKRYFCLV
jgi:hypothetical protein